MDEFRPGMPFGQLHPPSLQPTGFNPLGPGKSGCLLCTKT